MGSSIASSIHDLSVRHVQCTDHGEIVEIGAEGAADVVDTLRAEDLAPAHRHGCLLDGLVQAVALAGPGLQTDRVSPPVVDSPVLASVIAAEDVLLHAPKTSPPARI
ncbi:MAG TPA: hypothetical protein QGF58_03665 [Myxococcota bacterium]|nr:hypothetical protein [Myxococcota bacterium]